MTLECEQKNFMLSQGTIWDGSYLYDFIKGTRLNKEHLFNFKTE